MADLRTSPTPLAMLISTAIIAALSGYMIGIASSLGFLPIPFTAKKAPVVSRGVAHYDDEEESSEEDIDEGILDHAPDWGSAWEDGGRDGVRVRDRRKEKEEGKAEGERKGWEESKEQCKLVLVVRTDLGMTKGKIAAQCSHATLACYKSLLASTPRSAVLRRWESSGQAKIAVQVKTEEELLLLQARAVSLGVVAQVVADAGRTQIASGSYTVLGVGPAPNSVVDQITGGLRLL